jgi:hypothetical protein
LGGQRAVFVEQAFHHIEYRLVQCRVDHLALAAVDLAVGQRSQHADRAGAGQVAVRAVLAVT